MDNRQERTVERFVGALSWLDTKPLDPEPPLMAGMRESLRKSVRKLETLKGDQRRHEPRGPSVALRRDALRKTRMMPLRDIAKPLIEWAPGEAAMHVPRADASAATVAAAALRMADALMPHAALLRSAGITKDYLRQIRHEARSLALADRQRSASAANRKSATRGIAAEITKGIGTLGVIGGMITIHASKLLTQ